MQHRLTKGDALGQPHAAQTLGTVRCDLDVLEPAAQEFALGHHLGQHHGDDLQVLDLVFGVDALGAVLDHHDAHRPAAAQQGHAQEGVIGVLARFRPVGEGRVRRRVREGHRPALAHDFADQTLALLHPGDVHRRRVQAFGGEQLHLAGCPAQVDRADFRHHRAGDDAHHRVQLGLGRVHAGHGFSDLPKQTARSADGEAGRQGHGSMLSVVGRVLRPARHGWGVTEDWGPGLWADKGDFRARQRQVRHLRAKFLPRQGG